MNERADADVDQCVSLSRSRGFQCQKRSPPFFRLPNETLPIIAMRVSNP
jgi:hypothetical protein